MKTDLLATTRRHLQAAREGKFGKTGQAYDLIIVLSTVENLLVSKYPPTLDPVAAEKVADDALMGWCSDAP